MDSTERIELEIFSLANNGLGIGHIPFGKFQDRQMVVFVENALPGEQVVAEVFKQKPNFWLAKSVEIKNPSPHRAVPRCPNFPKDGDCVLQHLEYSEQLRWKQRWVEEALDRIGHIKNPRVELILPAPKIWHYRNKLELTFFDREGQTLLGFNEKGSFNNFLPAGDVTIGPPENARIIQTVNSFFSENPARVFKPQEKDGFLKNLIIQTSDTSWLLTLVTNEGEFDFDSFVKYICQDLDRKPADTGIFWMIQKNPGSAVRPEKIAAAFGREFFEEKIGENTFRIPPLGFFQVNPTAFEKLINFVTTRLQGKKPDLIEFYGGVGTIGILLHKKFKKILCVEAEEKLIEFARKNAAANNVENLEAIHQKAEDFAKDPLRGLPAQNSTTLLVDPPRDGLAPKVTRWILKNLPKKIIYFSCNPATLARDLNHLKGNYRITLIQPADLFPQVAHVEVLVILERPN